MESSPAKKNLGELLDERLGRSWTCAQPRNSLCPGFIPQHGQQVIAQRSCGCPIPSSVQGQVGWGLEQPGIVEGVPVHGRGGMRWALRSV